VNTIKSVVRRLAPLVLVAFAAGAIAAHADGGRRPVAPPAIGQIAAAPSSSGTVAAFGSQAVLAAPPPGGRVLVACKFTAKPPTPASTAPSQALLDAFPILRRERRPEDALPAEALQALKRRNLAPVSPDSARLLRTGPAGGRAWVVPVPDVSLPFPCLPKGKHAAREGLAVVAVGGAAVGGGGALADLVRGRAPVSVDPCAGAKHDMLSVSGVVPTGVAAVFLTAPDGTAVRADVKDNGYEFLIPRSKVPEQRFVVWTGGDGTPHVQPVTAFAPMPGALCGRLAVTDPARAPRVTPAGFGGCGFAAPLPLPVRRVRPKGGRVVPVPQRVLWDACAPQLLVAPAQPVPVPKPPRHK
jgi:hypothetical protein